MPPAPHGRRLKCLYAHIGGSVTITPFVLGIKKTASTSAISSGGTITYTVTPTLTATPGGPATVTAPDLEVVDTLPSSVVSVDTSGLAAPWTAIQTVSGTGNLIITFTYPGNASSATPLPPFSYTATTSLVAPASGEVTNSAQISAGAGPNAIAGPISSVTVSDAQADIVTKQKISDVGPDIQTGDPSVSWTTTWVNFQTTSQGPSEFVDVLPYNGDSRGTSFHGTATLSAANLEGAAASNGTLYYTTDAPGTIAAAPSGSTNWIAAGSTDLSTINGITAIKVAVSDFAAGAAGVGGVQVVMAVNGQEAGDVYGNTATGKTNTFDFSDGTPTDISVLGSSISGTVWHDANSDGLDNNAESGVDGVTVDLLNSSNAVVATTTTSGGGLYTFSELHSGTYTVKVVASSVPLGATPQEVVNTFSPDSQKDSASNPITLAENSANPGVDFGYNGTYPNFSATKTADKSSYIVGQAITYTIVETNSGAGAGSATVTDTVPGLVTVNSVSCVTSVATDTCVPGPQTNNVAGSVTLSPGATATFTITGVTNATGDAKNSVVTTPTDPGCATGCGGGTFTTGHIPVGDGPNFSATKTADKSSYIVGQAITYTIVETNSGAGAGSATVTDTVPASSPSTRSAVSPRWPPTPVCRVPRPTTWPARSPSRPGPPPPSPSPGSPTPRVTRRTRW